MHMASSQWNTINADLRVLFRPYLFSIPRSLRSLLGMRMGIQHAAADPVFFQPVPVWLRQGLRAGPEDEGIAIKEGVALGHHLGLSGDGRLAVGTGIGKWGYRQKQRCDRQWGQRFARSNVRFLSTCFRDFI